MLMELTEEEIQAVRELRAKNQEKRFGAWKPQLATDYSEEEKVWTFDKLHKMAIDQFESARENGAQDADHKQLFFEEVMNLLGPDVWNTYNKFLR